MRLTHFGGGVPFLGYAFSPGMGNYAPQTWEWLSEHGYRDAIMRLWGPGYLVAPVGFVRDISPAIGNAIAAKCDVALQIDNEPNIEPRGTASSAVYAQWALAVVAELRAVFPTCKLISPPIAQDAPNSVEWRQAMLPVVAQCDYLGWHYYHGRKPDDDAAGAIESPEWAREHYSDKPMVISECGSFANKHDVGAVFRRWMGYPWVRSLHWFILSAPNWPQFAFGDDEANLCYELCKEWRAVRSFPRGSAAPAPPPVTPPGGVDLHQLREDMSAQDALGKAVRGYGQEMVDRVKAVWDREGLEDV